MVDEFKILLDGQHRGASANDFGVSIQFDQSVNGVFVTFENEVTLSGGAYEYILSIAKQSFCDRIEVSCLYVCNGVSPSVIAKGFIFPSDCVFNRDDCTLTTKIVDDAFQSRINNNKAIQIYSQAPITKNGNAITDPYSLLPDGQRARMFTPSTGSYISPTQYSYGWSVFNAFKILVDFMSDGQMDFESSYFKTGEGNDRFLTSGASIRTGKRLQFLYSFESLYNALNRKSQLGFGFKVANGRPVLVIEKYQFFRNNASAITLYDVPGIKSRFDKERIFSTIDLGSDEFLEEWESTNPDVALSFAQVRFFGFKKESFGLTGLCNVDQTLDLVTKNVIFDTNIIEDILMHGNQGYEENPVLIQLPYFVGDAETYVTKDAGFIDIFGSGTAQYNPSFTNNQQAQNNIQGVPASIWNYYQGFNPDLTTFEGNSALPNFSINFTDTPPQQFFSDPDKANQYLPFHNEIIDAGNNYDPIVTGNLGPLNGSRYVVPAPGSYSFFARIKKNAGVAATLFQRIVFVRYNSAGDIIVKRFQSVQTLPGGVDVCAEANDTFFCNTGDQIWVDVEVELFDVASYNYVFTTELGVGLCFSEPVQFSGSGVPIVGGELQPYDPDQYKPVIDTYRYPLSFSQIVALLNDTTRSVAYTDDPDDPFTLKRGDILKITIPSLGINLADFELKTFNL